LAPAIRRGTSTSNAHHRRPPTTSWRPSTRTARPGWSSATAPNPWTRPLPSPLPLLHSTLTPNRSRKSAPAPSKPLPPRPLLLCSIVRPADVPPVTLSSPHVERQMSAGNLRTRPAVR
jgi:hypothetical protein